jgi:hypothetical protein
MRSLIRTGKNIILFLFIVILISNRLYCYIDPGTGSYIIQLIVAGIIGISFTVKLFWKRIKAFLSKNLSRKTRE